MCRVLLAICIWFAVACPATAGAWLRERGQVFLATTVTLYKIAQVSPYKSSLYGEWGVLDRLTLGMDFNERPAVSGHALLFARLPIPAPGSRNTLAIELGAGGHHWRNNWSPMYKLAVSFGRGWQTALGPGWLAIDTAVEHRRGKDEDLYKLDLTTGLSGQRRFNPLLQIETAYASGADLYWTVTPSVMIRGRNETRWVVGVERKSHFPDAIGLKLGVWTTF